MLTGIKIENFKKLECISFQLSSSVVIIGPNNSGKSTIFQALCLWEIGVRNFLAAKEQKKLNRNAIKEIFPGLKGLALFNKIYKNIKNIKPLNILCWERRELENYFARPAVLLKHAESLSHQYEQYTAGQLRDIMQQVITDNTTPNHLRNLNDDWWNTAKLSDEWLDKIFSEFYNQIGINTGANFKRDYYKLISLLDKQEIPQEVTEKLDTIYDILK